jgi:hypothetical protein
MEDLLHRNHMKSLLEGIVKWKVDLIGGIRKNLIKV